MAPLLASDPFAQVGYSPAELRRALHNASITLSIAEIPGASAEVRGRGLFLARGKLAAILGRLDHAIAMVEAERLLSPSTTDTPITAPITSATTATAVSHR